MGIIKLTMAYMRFRPLNTTLNLVLLALGIGTLTVLLLFSAQFEYRLSVSPPAAATQQLAGLTHLVLESLHGLGLAMIFAAALGIFIALYNAMHERRGDLAIMRCLGASRFTLVLLVLTEGLLITGLGTLTGLACGHLMVELATLFSTRLHDLGLTGRVWLEQETWLVVMALGMGALASAMPAIQAYRTDIARTLAEL